MMDQESKAALKQLATGIWVIVVVALCLAIAGGSLFAVFWVIHRFWDWTR